MNRITRTTPPLVIYGRKQHGRDWVIIIRGADPR
jgi:hypothetical protein